MKLRYLFSMILASALMLVSCVDEMGTDSFDNIKLDKTMLVISENGGTVELKVNATEAWAFDTTYTQDVWPNVIKYDTNKDTGVKTLKSCDASWLSVDRMAGEAGETVLKFSADTAAGGRELELCIKAGVNSQFIKVRQGSLEASAATCAEVIAGPDGKTYRVKGVCTSIANTTYGNWYLNDGTGEVYVYGTLDKDGKTKNYESWGMEVGDVVEVEGPKLTYGTTVELVDVTVISIQKSLVKVITEEKTFEKEGGEFEVKVAYKGDGLYPVVADTCKTWVSLVGVKSYSGTPTKIEPNPADTAIVTFSLAPFEEKAAPRKGFLTFTSASGKNSTEVVYNITQKGLIPDPTPIKDATKVGEGICVEGTVVALCSQGYILNDETGSILIYHPEDGWECNVVVGDKVRVAADKLGAYNFSAQLKTPYFEEKVSEEPAEVTYPTPVNYDATKVNAVVDALKAAVDPANKEKEVALKVEYINMTGKLVIDGKYHNVEIAGSQYQGSLYNPLESLKLADYNGKVITLGGYFLSISQQPTGVFKFINMVVTSVAEAGDVVFPELKFSKTSDKVEPTATEYTFDITSNLKWTLTASEGVTLDKKSGEGNATVKMTFAANETEDAIEHTVTAKADGAADVTLTVTQATAAAPTEATVAEFLAAEVGSRLFKLTGRVSGIKGNDQYGNFNLVDATGTVYVYGLTATPVSKNDKSFQSLGLKEGDIVTLVGTRDSYTKDGVTTDQVGGPAYYVSHVSHKDISVADFLNAPEDDTWYKLTGTISNIAMDKYDATKQNAYGNFDLTEGDATVAVYGLTVAPVSDNDKSFSKLGLKNGDTVTLIGKRSSYKGTPQVGGPAYYVSHVAAE